MSTIQAAKAIRATSTFDLSMYLSNGDAAGRPQLEAQAKEKLFSDVRAAGYEPIDRTFTARWYGPVVGVASVVGRRKL